MKYCLALLTLYFSLFSNLTAAQIVPFSSDAWTVSAEESRVETFLGKESLFLRGGEAWIASSDFTDGVIEFDIAFSSDRNFNGVTWRRQDENNHEHFYLRPHQSGNPDAMQYTPVFNGTAGWQLYHGPAYGVPYPFRFDEWMHVKIVVSGSQGAVYIDSDEPVLLIPEMKREMKSGSVGLTANRLAPAHFTNFSYTSVDAPALGGTPNDLPAPPEGVIETWSVTQSFAESEVQDILELPSEATDGKTWTRLESESTGITNLARRGVLTGESNTVFARLNIQSESEQVKTIRFGYSDRIRVFVNGRKIYAGNNGYMTRDYRYLGTIGLFDEITVHLMKGSNEILFAVSESFGGWGIIAAISDRSGIRIID